MEMCIEMAGDSPPREWLRSLHSWLASHGKPRWTAEPVENLQAQRLQRARVYLKAGGVELGYCETFVKQILSRLTFHESWVFPGGVFSALAVLGVEVGQLIDFIIFYHRKGGGIM